MRRSCCAVSALLATLGIAHAEPRPDDFVEIAPLIPDAVIDLRYATKANFTGEQLYPRAVCKLRRAVAEQLATAAKQLREHDRRIVLWDCYRPKSVQAILWKHRPDARYVADPKVGSVHSRGAAVDIGLADKAGTLVALPTEYDDGTRAAHRDRALVGEHGREARTLDAAMTAAGFVGLPTEWWHYDAKDAAFPLADDPL